MSRHKSPNSLCNRGCLACAFICKTTKVREDQRGILVDNFLPGMPKISA